MQVDIRTINHYTKIPFLPIEVFKHKVVKDHSRETKIVFKSSGTTGMVRSEHHITDANLYQTSARASFEHFFGSLSDYIFIALLPSYQDQGDSSLIYMIDDFIKLSSHPASGYYPNIKACKKVLDSLSEDSDKKIILWGVSYALLDFIEAGTTSYPNLMVLETGGMKGKRPELTKENLHTKLKVGFNVDKIYSEYGMTELLSQSYSIGEGIFNTPPWKKILSREVSDPLTLLQKNGKTGGLNVIDLANIHSCSFIATQDLVRITEEGFRIMGRFDHSDTRGCNLLVQ